MCYHIKYWFLVLVLSVYVYELQCSGKNDDKEEYNQRNILIDYFQNALMNDSQQLLMLQKAFLLPRRIGGRCLIVDISVKGRVMDNDDYVSSLYNDLCNSYLRDENLCICNTSISLELIPAPAAPDPSINFTVTLADF